ncbi:hypothetical protein G6F63_014915 [Rhizopus arrhizus]|nr:hypothetical protein G6F63_014915 [Rhizopus arrhizus]KAG1606644.1 hypothetical protein G6F45_013936 [Rhizopus arrhizus]
MMPGISSSASARGIECWIISPTPASGPAPVGSTNTFTPSASNAEEDTGATPPGCRATCETRPTCHSCA